MEKRQLGRTDLEVSSICLGTMIFGGQVAERDAFLQMDFAAARGVNFLDTAEIYTIPPTPETAGDSERIVGRWMKERKNRASTVIATKFCGRSSSTWLRQTASEVRATQAQIMEAVEGSLDKLQTDYIDLYQMHWPDRRAPMFGADSEGYRHYDNDYVGFDEILGAMQALQDQGKVRHFGVSNETSWGVMAFLRDSQKLGYPRVASIQNAYNLLNRYFEYGLAEIALNEQTGLLAYSPLASGFLTGKYQKGALPAGSRMAAFGERFTRYRTPSAEGVIADYLGVAEEFGVDPAQMALQFVTTRPWVTSNIIGARTQEQLETDLDSVQLEWTQELENAINAVHKRIPNPCP